VPGAIRDPKKGTSLVVWQGGGREHFLANAGMATVPNVPVGLGTGTRMACGIRYDRAHEDRMVRALVSSLWTAMTHQNFINAISAFLVCGWLSCQVANAAEQNAAAAPAADAAAQARVVVPPKADSAAAEITPNPDDAIICKKEDVLGSRVRKAKVCRTKKEWQIEAQAAKDFIKGIDKGTAAQPGGETLPSGG
jgi:hypothetical protein